MKATVVLALALLETTSSGRAQQSAPPVAAPPAQMPTQMPGQMLGQTPGQTPAPPAGPVTDPTTDQTAAPAPIQTPAASSATETKIIAVAPNYVLGIDDGIVVNVYKDATFSGPLMIRPDGKITLPLLGDVQAAGLTPMALAADLTERLKKFILDPSVTVNVSAVNSKRVFFIGEVNKAGPLPLDPDMTVLQAISTAGGLSPYARSNKIYILRGPAGKQQKIPFDYKKAVKTGNQQGVILMAGDTIVVP